MTDLMKLKSSIFFHHAVWKTNKRVIEGIIKAIIIMNRLMNLEMKSWWKGDLFQQDKYKLIHKWIFLIRESGVYHIQFEVKKYVEKKSKRVGCQNQTLWLQFFYFKIPWYIKSNRYTRFVDTIILSFMIRV